MADIFCTIGTQVTALSNFLWGWPLLILFGITVVYATIATHFVQLREWHTSWRMLLASEHLRKSGAMLTSFQAFLNTLSSSMGNGSIAGMATALYSGGPGVAFWIFVIGFFTLALRVVEVFASTYYVQRIAGVLRGGPFVFLQRVPGGSIVAWLYAASCLMTSLIAGCAMQCNSMSVGIQRLTGASVASVSVLLFLGVMYSLTGGAQRIVRLSEYVIPVKVFLFFGATLWVLAVHWYAIPSALATIYHEAFRLQVGVGLLHGYTIWSALRFGVARSLSATEAGLGTAGILFGSTGTERPGLSALMSMPALFLSNHIVCCSLILVFMVTGVWHSGLNGTAMTCAAYETVFGSFGAALVTILSITFGLGVLIAYALIGRACWQFLCGARMIWLFNVLFCMSALLGTTLEISLVWHAVDLANGAMLLFNVYGLIYLMPQVSVAMQHAIIIEKRTL